MGLGLRAVDLSGEEQVSGHLRNQKIHSLDESLGSSVHEIRWRFVAPEELHEMVADRFFEDETFEKMETFADMMARCVTSLENRISGGLVERETMSDMLGQVEVQCTGCIEADFVS